MDEQSQDEAKDVTQKLQTVDVGENSWSSDFLQDFCNGYSHCGIVHDGDKFPFFINCDGLRFVNHLLQLILYFLVVVNEILLRAEYLKCWTFILLRSWPMLNLYLMFQSENLIWWQLTLKIRIDNTSRRLRPSRKQMD